MFRVVTQLIIRNSYHCICSIWHYWDRTAACLERDWMGTGIIETVLLPVLNVTGWELALLRPYCYLSWIWLDGNWHYWDRTATCLEYDWMGTGIIETVYLPILKCSSHPVTFKTGSSTISIMPHTADTVIWAPDDGWSYHSKYVEQFRSIN
jgi:hypothetical protein